MGETVIQDFGCIGRAAYIPMAMLCHSLVGMFARVIVRRRMMIFYTRAGPWPIGIGIKMNIGGAIGPGAGPGSSADGCHRLAAEEMQDMPIPELVL